MPAALAASATTPHSASAWRKTRMRSGVQPSWRWVRFGRPPFSEMRSSSETRAPQRRRSAKGTSQGSPSPLSEELLSSLLMVAPSVRVAGRRARREASLSEPTSEARHQANPRWRPAAVRLDLDRNAISEDEDHDQGGAGGDHDDDRRLR